MKYERLITGLICLACGIGIGYEIEKIKSEEEIAGHEDVADRAIEQWQDCIDDLTTFENHLHAALERPNIRMIPDVAIEQEFLRRTEHLGPETCTYCGEKWRSCECQFSDNPAMFQNREKRKSSEVAAEVEKYNAPIDRSRLSPID